MAENERILWALGLGILVSLLALSSATEKSVSGSLKSRCAIGSFAISCAADGNACFDSENVTCCGCRAKDCWGCESLACPLTPFGNCTVVTPEANDNNFKIALPSVIVLGILVIIGILVGFALYLRHSRRQRSRWWSKGVSDSDLPSLDEDDLPSVALLQPHTTSTKESTLRVTDHVLLDPWSKQYEPHSPTFRNSYTAAARPTELLPRGTKGGPKKSRDSSSMSPSEDLVINKSDDESS